MAKRSKKDKDHALATEAKGRVTTIIDAIPPEELVSAIKRAPSLRGMILGYIAEEMFEKHVLNENPDISHVQKHDDHDRSVNKSDRDFRYNGRKYSIQLKSVQTNSIAWLPEDEVLVADVQNDASDRRAITLPNGHKVETTNYAIGDYDILAVPLFPFSGEWEFAYKRNRDCRLTDSKKYSEEDKQYLLPTTEKLHYPLSDGWTTDLPSLLDDSLGEPADE
ncbi:MAG: hypothetical protein JNM32_01505 [Dechloromonas sp.]|nr:hypothetical protein [Dechloromonas sp.]